MNNNKFVMQENTVLSYLKKDITRHFAHICFTLTHNYKDKMRPMCLRCVCRVCSYSNDDENKIYHAGLVCFVFKHSDFVFVCVLDLKKNSIKESSVITYWKDKIFLMGVKLLDLYLKDCNGNIICAHITNYTFYYFKILLIQPFLSSCLLSKEA